MTGTLDIGENCPGSGPFGTVLQVAQQRQQSLEALHDQGSVHIVGEGYCDSTDDSVRRRGPSQLVGAGALLGSHKLRRSKHATRCDTNAPQRQPATQTVVAVVALTRRWSHQVVALTRSLVRFQHRLDPRGTTRSQDLEQFHSTANTLAMCFCETVERMMCTCKVNRDASDMKTTTQSCAGPDRRRQNVGRSASRQRSRISARTGNPRSSQGCCNGDTVHSYLTTRIRKLRMCSSGSPDGA